MIELWTTLPDITFIPPASSSEVNTSMVPSIVDISPMNSLQSKNISSIGIDSIALHRLAKSLRRHPYMFQRLSMREELPQHIHCTGMGLLWACCLWTGKEAIAKCLKTGIWREGVTWADLGVGSESFYQQLKTQNYNEHASYWYTWAHLHNRAYALAQSTECYLQFQLYQSSQSASGQMLKVVTPKQWYQYCQLDTSQQSGPAIKQISMENTTQNMTQKTTQNSVANIEIDIEIDSLFMVAHAVHYKTQTSHKQKP